jgi:hypothetical protein
MRSNVSVDCENTSACNDVQDMRTHLPNTLFLGDRLPGARQCLMMGIFVTMLWPPSILAHRMKVITESYEHGRVDWSEVRMFAFNSIIVELLREGKRLSSWRCIVSHLTCT